ncbi:MAG: LacI family DNA-binding transcriptional regulator [Solobacterium sp.]|nr:LacI family DNA-binding transcriptional regulator [Solobacterium sp.]
MATIKDIAKLSGYSVGTVSRVLNDRPDVSETARQRIKEIIEQENFRPNTNAKLLKQVHASPVAVLVKGSSNHFLTLILEKVQWYLHQAGEDATVVFLEESANEALAAQQLFRESNPKGLLFLGGDLKNLREHYPHTDVPSVLVSASAKDLGISAMSSFCTDDYEGGRAAMSLLVENGHRHVCIVGGFASDEPEQVSVRRLNGAVSVLKEHGIAFDASKQYVQSIFSMEDGYRAVRTALSNDPDITAVFALSDLIAIGGMRAVHELGLRVPEDVSFIGFDGIEYAEYTVPRLVTVRQDIDTLARKSVEDLLYRINYKREAVHRCIPFSLTGKESVSRID